MFLIKFINGLFWYLGIWSVYIRSPLFWMVTILLLIFPLGTPFWIKAPFWFFLIGIIAPAFIDAMEFYWGTYWFNSAMEKERKFWNGVFQTVKYL